MSGDDYAPIRLDEALRPSQIIYAKIDCWPSFRLLSKQDPETLRAKYRVHLFAGEERKQLKTFEGCLIGALAGSCLAQTGVGLTCRLPVVVCESAPMQRPKPVGSENFGLDAKITQTTADSLLTCGQLALDDVNERFGAFCF